MLNGLDPPAQSLIPPDPPSIPRPCIECGKMHDTGLQDTKTGEMIERFDTCRDCWMTSLINSFYENIEKADIDRIWTFEELDKWNKEKIVKL